MKQYVCGLELSKKLYEAGIIKDAESWWVNEIMHVVTNKKWRLTTGGYAKHLQQQYLVMTDKAIPAPMAEELLSKMPTKIYLINSTHEAHIDIRFIDKCITFKTSNEIINIEYSGSENLSNDLAVMLLHLEKEGYLKGE